jgi:hypothetical protein
MSVSFNSSRTTTAKQGDSIQIRWDAGVFVLENAPGSLQRIARDTDDDHRFLELLAKYHGQGRKMSHRPQPISKPKTLWQPESKRSARVQCLGEI